MPRKNQPALRIDASPPVKFGGTQSETAESMAPPALPTIPAPEDLALTTAIQRSAVTPMALISATWSQPPGAEPQYYHIQWSTSNTFPVGSTSGADAAGTSATLEGLTPATLYYVRVAAIYRLVQSDWSTAASITTASDNTAPNPVSSLTTTFGSGTAGNGDCIITWTNPTSANFKDVQVDIYTANGGTLLRTVYSSTGRFVYTAAMNWSDTSNAPDASLYIVTRARSYSNIYSTSVATTATKAAPNAVTGFTATWDGVTGNLSFSWTPSDVVSVYSLTLDGIDRKIGGTRYDYTLGRNRTEHGGTADPSISYSIRAIDALNQMSTAVSGTATLAPPAQPTGLTTSWAGDTGTAGPDCTINWTPAADVAYYSLTIDGTVYKLTGSRYTYTLDANRAAHGGTPDPSLSISLVARDALDQSSSPAATTATNAAPAAPSSVTLTTGGVSTMLITIGGTTPSDLQHYTVRVLYYGGAIETLTKKAPAFAHQAVEPGNYQIGVRVVDMFNQSSAETLSASVNLDFLTISHLRSAAVYSDSDSNTYVPPDGGTLAALKDGNHSSGGVTYAA